MTHHSEESSSEADVQSQSLQPEDLDQVVAGVDVKIEQVSSTVSTADDGTLSPGVIDAIVSSVLDALRRRR
ncbi:MAG TPA: hypothetical protein VMV46_21845 [Thermoanaerobaculia bacterium]|nr:hypothetical protein [Thermoanaerobaculia bacterium]